MCDQQRFRPACAYAQSDQSLCWSHEYSMNIKLLTAYHLGFLSLKGGCTGSSESIHVQMPCISAFRFDVYPTPRRGFMDCSIIWYIKFYTVLSDLIHYLQFVCCFTCQTCQELLLFSLFSTKYLPVKHVLTS